MAAFDRIKSGIPEMDVALDNIRLGDNVVWRVSGSYYGPYYMPCAAGVGYSYSPYKFLQGIDQSAGMLRLVMGLGTSAVDRTQGSYPRLVSLDMPDEHVLLESIGASMGLSRDTKIDVIVYVDPVAYYNMPYAKKPEIASVIGKINWKYRGSGRHMLLMVLGRVGTSSPELGVPTTFADISEFEAVCEIEESEAGYNPELSYGSHIFQDLVESDIMYTAVFKNEKTKRFAPEVLREGRDVSLDHAGSEDNAKTVRVYDMTETECRMYFDLKESHLLVKV